MFCLYCKITNNVTISGEKVILPKIIFKYDFGQIVKIYRQRGNRSLNLPFQSSRKKKTRHSIFELTCAIIFVKNKFFISFLLRLMALKCLRKTDGVEIFHEIYHNLFDKVWLKIGLI